MEAGARPRRPPVPSHITVTDAETFDKLHGEAHRMINKALTFDESNDMDSALMHYKSGVDLMRKALSISVNSDQMPDVLSKKEKLSATLEYAESRIKELNFQKTATAAAPQLRQTALPSYREATSPDSAHPPVSDSSAPFNADVLFEIPCAQGYVSTPSYPSPLRICKFNQQSIPGTPNHFLQIGNWTYPLIEDVSPTLQKSDYTYVFPDVTSTEEGAAVGIILDENSSTTQIDTFEALLHELSAVERSQTSLIEDAQAPTGGRQAPYTEPGSQAPPRPPPPPANKPPQAVASAGQLVSADTSTTAASSSRLSTKVGHGLAVAADYISWGLEKGAEKLSVAMSYGGEKLRENINPAREETPVGERTRQGIVVARSATHKVLQLSSSAVKLLGEATMALGRKAAPHVKTQAKKYLPQSVTSKMTAKDSSGHSKMDDLLEVAGAGVRGFGTVYLGLEEAAKSLGRSLTHQTAATAAHRYGTQIGEATENAMFAAGNTLLSAHNVSNLGPKAIAKRAAKDTAKALINKEPQAKTTGHTLEIVELPDNDNNIEYPNSKSNPNS